MDLENKILIICKSSQWFRLPLKFLAIGGFRRLQKWEI